MRLGDVLQSADWKKEKHVPIIECPDKVKSGEQFEIKLSIGKEIAHPNTTDHHIRWIQVYFKPEGGKFAYQLANAEFTAHGESTDGADKGPVYTHHSVTVAVTISQPGTILAMSLCNIHGLWENVKEIKM